VERLKSLLLRKSPNLILVVLAVAAAIRLWSISYGLPYSYYPDEAHLINRALAFGSGDLNPHWFHKPAFYMYILFFEYGVYYVFGWFVGFWNSVDGYAVRYVTDPGAWILIGRLTTSAFSVATVWLVYRLGKRHFHKNVGIMAALFLTFSCGAVESSQTVKEDIPAGFFATLSMLFLLNVLANEHRKFLYFAAAAAGMGSAIKAYPIAMLLPIFLTIVIANRSGRGLRHDVLKVVGVSAAAVCVYVLVYFACSPYSFLDPLGRRSSLDIFVRAYEGIVSFFGVDTGGAADDFYTRRVGTFQGALQYVKVLLSSAGMGVPIGLVCFVGWMFLMVRAQSKTMVLWLYPAAVAAAAVLVFPGYAQPRHQTPIYPVLSVCGGYAVFAIASRVTPPWSKLIYAGACLLLILPGYILGDRALDKAKQDTRNVAKAWIEAHIPAGATILVDENGPRLFCSPEKIVPLLKKAQQADPRGQFTANYATYLKYELAAAKEHISYDLHEIRQAWWREKESDDGVEVADSDYDRDYGNPLRPVGVESYEFYKTSGFKYAIVHSDAYGRYQKEGTSVRRKRAKYAQFYAELFAQAELVVEFTPESGSYRGPEVKIFRLN